MHQHLGARVMKLGAKRKFNLVKITTGQRAGITVVLVRYQGDSPRTQ
jgi:hypothetical protein